MSFRGSGTRDLPKAVPGDNGLALLIMGYGKKRPNAYGSGGKPGLLPLGGNPAANGFLSLKNGGTLRHFYWYPLLSNSNEAGAGTNSPAVYIDTWKCGFSV